MTKLISGRIAKVDSANVSADRYQFIGLAETEPDLGLPAVAGYVLASDRSGNRSWISVTSTNFANISTTANVAYTANIANTVSTLSNFNTANLVEGINLYFTNARVLSYITPYLTTANVLESSSNLYYTNARVYSNTLALLPTLAGPGIIITANGQISANTSIALAALTANIANTVLTLSNFTTANLAEGTNLYYTNNRTRSAFSAGTGIAITSGGVISTRETDVGGGIFNAGIQYVGNVYAQSAYSNVKVFGSSEGNTFIGYSFHITNITNNIVYLTGRHIFDSNTILFANLLEMPVGASMEIFRKPQVFKVGDTIQIQGFDQNKNAVSNGISSYLSYQASADSNYQRAGNTITGSALTTIYQTVNRVSVFESINLVNLSPNVIYGTVIITDGSDNIAAYLAANLAIPAYASVDVCEYPKTLLEDYKIKVQKSDNYNPLSVFTSSKYTQSFAITPSVTTLSESEATTIDLSTTNIINGTVLYYSLAGATGNVNQNDFITNITGTLTVQNNSARLILQANADLNTNSEGDESFNIVLRKGSNTGIIVATSDVITLKDTSNVTSYTLTDNTGGAAVLESSTIIFTLSTINLPPNTTYYYNSNGTVISSYFTAGNTGSFISNANTTYNIVFAGAGSIPDMTSATFKLEVRSGSLTGPILATSNTVTILDAALADVQATGGTIIVDNGYKVHTYTTSGNLTVSSIGISGNIEYLVIAGGGGGGTGLSGFPKGGGGGGAGGYLTGNTTLSTAGTYIVTVGGGGGSSPTVNNQNGTSGNNSNIFNPALSIISIGGGGGGARNTAGYPGGSGGGSMGVAGGTGTPGQGNPGGSGSDGAEHSGGGGGAGGAGGNPGIRSGGIGLSSSITGTSVTRAGGGSGGVGPGGGAIEPSSGGGGGTGGFGGTGGGTATVNTGGGGGGGTAFTTGGSGGSGIVIIKYPYSAETYNFYTTNVYASNTIIDNSNITYNLQTINVANATTLYWTLTGNVTNSDVIGGNTGSFTVVNSNANILIALANNITSGNATKSFALQIRKVSITGAVAATANTVTVYSGSNSNNFVNATGGNVITGGGYRTHVLTSSNTFTVSSTGVLGSVVDYLIIAGGGGGAGGNPNTNNGGAGAGAGGLLTGTYVVSVQSYSANVGAGGTGGSGYGIVGTNGSNTDIFGMLTVGGGGGAWNQFNNSYGQPGGSGAGAGGSIASSGYTLYGGLGIAGQGYPGGTMFGSNPGGNSSAGGGGAGGAGQSFTGYENGPRAGGVGRSISWAPGSYGTTGPAPGQWFAGGGGGATDQNVGAQGPGGAGGGGRGAMAGPQALTAFSGNVFTGGGGGGGHSPGYPAGSGGSGIIIIRYPYV